MTKKPKLLVSCKDKDIVVILARARKIAKENNMEHLWPVIYADATCGGFDDFTQTLSKYFDIVFD